MFVRSLAATELLVAYMYQYYDIFRLLYQSSNKGWNDCIYIYVKYLLVIVLLCNRNLPGLYHPIEFRLKCHLQQVQNFQDRPPAFRRGKHSCLIF